MTSAPEEVVLILRVPGNCSLWPGDTCQELLVPGFGVEKPSKPGNSFRTSQEQVPHTKL